jgi:hypothetical protein
VSVFRGSWCGERSVTSIQLVQNLTAGSPMPHGFLVTNKLRGITSNLMAIEHVKPTKAVDRLAGKSAQWNGDHVSVECFRNLTPARPR